MRQLIAIALALIVFACSSRGPLGPARSNGGDSVLPLVIQTGQEPVRFVEFNVPTPNAGPFDIVRGPDGAMWFTEAFAPNIGRIDMSGHVTEFFVGGRGQNELTVGDDGNIWYTQSGPNLVGRLTPIGVLTKFPISQPTWALENIVEGPDQRLWFENLAYEGGPAYVDAITVNGAISQYGPVDQTCYFPLGLTVGADHNLWASGGHCVSRISRYGTITSYQLGSGVSLLWIIAGSDGNLWATDNGDGSIDRISYSAAITKYPVSGALNDLYGIVQVGTRLFFAETAADKIGRFSEVGQSFSSFDVPTAQSEPSRLAEAPDRNVWFTEFNKDKIGVYIRRVLSISPQSVTLVAGQSTPLIVSENGSDNVWSASSSDPSIATVSGPTGNQFLATGVNTGNCTITISDQRGNSFNVAAAVK